METLKFLMITTHFPPHHLGGDAVFVEYLSKELAKRGHEVHVFHSPGVYGLIRGIDSSVSTSDSEDGVNRHPYRSRNGTLEPMMVLALGLDSRPTRAAAELAANLNPDVIHWHNTRGFIGRPLIFRNEISMYTSHDYGAICPRSNLLRPNLAICGKARMCIACSIRWRKPPQIWRANSCRVVKFPANTRILSPSRFVANRLSAEGVKVHEIIRNFVPDPESSGDVGTIPRDILVYQGMLEIHKGLRTLVRAFIKSIRRQELELDIIGEGSLRMELANTVSKAGLADRIRIHGFLERKEAEVLRRQSMAQVVPSEWLENCPLTVLEAYALGVPVVGSNLGGMPEIVGTESGSRVFSGGDVDALAEVFVDLWENRHRRNEYSRKARETYEMQYRPDVHLTRYMDLIDGSV